jgi:hypothetical protein
MQADLMAPPDHFAHRLRMVKRIPPFDKERCTEFQMIEEIKHIRIAGCEARFRWVRSGTETLSDLSGRAPYYQK